MTVREGRLIGGPISEYHVVILLLYAAKSGNNTGNLVESSLYYS